MTHKTNSIWAQLQLPTTTIVAMSKRSHHSSLQRRCPWRSRASSYSDHSSFSCLLVSSLVWMCICCCSDIWARALTEAEIVAKEVAWARRVAAKHQQQAGRSKTTAGIHRSAHSVTAKMDEQFTGRTLATASMLQSVEEINEAIQQDSLSLQKLSQQPQEQQQLLLEDRYLRRGSHSPTTASDRSTT